MLKFTSENILEGIMPGTDCENYFKFRWLGESSTKSFYIGDDENQKRKVLEFLSGRQECFIDRESFFKYLDDLKEIVEKFKFLFYGPISVLNSIRAHFSALSTNECSIYVSYRQGDRYLKASSLDKNVNELRNALVPNITNLKFVKDGNRYTVYVSLIDEWRDVIMKANSKLTVEKLCKIYDEFMRAEIKSGKTQSDAALLFGIKYAQLFDNFPNKTINELLKESTYNTNDCIAYVQKGTILSSSVLWETGVKANNDEQPATIEEEVNIFEGFKAWLTTYDNPDYTGREAYGGYPRNLQRLVQFMKENGYIDDDNLNDKNIEKFENIKNIYDKNREIKEFDDRYLSSCAGIAALKKYIKYLEFLNKKDKKIKLIFKTPLGCEKSRNRIFFGAPGTGKSHELDKQTKDFSGDCYERVTFHPEYTHSAFFGTYKPVPNPTDSNKITYAFIPGPFLRVLSKALIDANIAVNPQPFVLLIEEINRANMAAVFGEVFQLLDRDDNNVSKYSISPSEDVKKYLVDEFAKAGVCAIKEDFSELRIPNNMFIWASMNSADQGVFPMDTAFKRRWEFEYFDINKNEEIIKAFSFKVKGEEIKWNALRKAINKQLTSLKINEDKLMGPFFIGKSVFEDGNDEQIVKTINNKVIMYLFEDAARQRRNDVFVGGYDKTYYRICEDFKNNGIKIFTEKIINFYNENIK